LSNWSGDCTGTAPCVVTMSAPRNVTANFAPTGYPVNVTAPAGVSFTLNGVTYVTSASVWLAPGSYTLSTTSPQSTGAGVQAAFVSWSDGGALSHQITVAAPVNISGTFKTQYSFSASVVPANQGTLTLISSGGSGPFYDPGTVVLVTPTANPGYQFQYWSGACSGSSPGCFVTVNAPTSVTANFSIPPTWVQLFPLSSPPAILGGVMAWDGARQQSILVGGPSVFAPLSDTFVFDGINWAQQNPVTHPPMRSFSAMAYGSNNRILLFGGEKLDS